jgi:hypothetical protein
VEKYHNPLETEEKRTQGAKDRRIDNTIRKRQKDRQHKDQKTEE